MPLATASVKAWFPAFTKCMANPRHIQTCSHFCIATTAVLSRPELIDESPERNGDRLRLITRAGRLPLFRAAQIGDEAKCLAL
jgi:hypothetical protein